MGSVSEAYGGTAPMDTQANRGDSQAVNTGFVATVAELKAAFADTSINTITITRTIELSKEVWGDTVYIDRNLTITAQRESAVGCDHPALKFPAYEDDEVGMGSRLIAWRYQNMEHSLTLQDIDVYLYFTLFGSYNSGWSNGMKQPALQINGLDVGEHFNLVCINARWICYCSSLTSLNVLQLLGSMNIHRPIDPALPAKFLMDENGEAVLNNVYFDYPAQQGVTGWSMTAHAMVIACSPIAGTPNDIVPRGFSTSCWRPFEPLQRYVGTANTTASGRACLPWAALDPGPDGRLHYTPQHHPLDYLEANYCRSPLLETVPTDGTGIAQLEELSPWCYTEESTMVDPSGKAQLPRGVSLSAVDCWQSEPTGPRRCWVGRERCSVPVCDTQCNCDRLCQKQRAMVGLPATCRCDTPGAGTVGHNAFQCSDASLSGHCASHEECRPSEPFAITPPFFTLPPAVCHRPDASQPLDPPAGLVEGMTDLQQEETAGDSEATAAPPPTVPSPPPSVPPAVIVPLALLVGLIVAGSWMAVRTPWSGKRSQEGAELVDLVVGDPSSDSPTDSPTAGSRTPENPLASSSIISAVPLDSLRTSHFDPRTSFLGRRVGEALDRGALPGLALPLAGAASGSGSAPAGGPSQAAAPPIELGVDLGEVTLEAQIGTGAFGHVYKGLWNGVVVAVKQVAAAASLPRHSLVAKEVHLTEKLRHPNIITTYHSTVNTCPCRDVAFQDRSLEMMLYEGILVLEYGEGDMNDAIERGLLREPGGGVHMKRVLNLLKDTANGMVYVHQRHIIHADLKPGNIFYVWQKLQGGPAGAAPQTSPGGGSAAEHQPAFDIVAKIGDFGLAKVFRAEGGTSGSGAGLATSVGADHITGTITHLPPEVLAPGGAKMLTPKADVFAFGIVMWQLYVQRQPYEGLTRQDVVDHVLASPTLSANLSLPSDCPQGYRELAEKCCCRDPEERPCFTDIVATINRLKTAQGA